MKTVLVALGAVVMSLGLVVGGLVLGRVATVEHKAQPPVKTGRNPEGEYSVTRDGKVLLVVAQADERRVCFRWRDGGQPYCFDRPATEPVMVMQEKR